MDFTPKLSLPYLLPNQAQKHVTLNESLKRLDRLVQLVVQSFDLAQEPTSPFEGTCYIMPLNPTGTNWDGQTAGDIASYVDGYWEFIPAQIGWRAYNIETAQMLIKTDTGWLPIEPQKSPYFGINTDADETNRLAVKSDAELLSHDDITPGTGDARKIVNKSASDKTASLVLQESFSPKAEIGLTGDNNLSIKVFDGSEWHSGVVFDENTGQASFPSGIAHAETGAIQRGLVFLSGGDGDVSVYRNDTSRTQNPRMYSLSAVSGDTFTLTTSDAEIIFLNSFMKDVCYLRIWNTSKVPAESAWVKEAVGSTQIRVVDSASIASWLPGETIQVGDPLDVTPNRCMALDISPMLQQQLGAVFPQAGLLFKVGCIGTASSDTMLDLSPSGASGSFSAVKSFSGGDANFGQVIMATTEPSPISDSNLIFIREHDDGGQMSVCLASVLGVYV